MKYKQLKYITHTSITKKITFNLVILFKSYTIKQITIKNFVKIKILVKLTKLKSSNMYFYHYISKKDT